MNRSGQNRSITSDANSAKLRQERDELVEAKKAAEDAALAKAGEIAIVRANQTKAERIFEFKIQSFQNQRQEEAAKQRLEVERALAEKQKIATEKGFLQSDLAEGNRQIKNLQRTVKAKDAASKAVSAEDVEVTALPMTPKKNKSVNHADGFDHDEMQPQLPYRSKNNTPKAGSKRKRKPVKASPVKPLQLSQAHQIPEPVDVSIFTPEESIGNPATASAAPPAAPNFPPVAPPDGRFDVR